MSTLTTQQKTATVTARTGRNRFARQQAAAGWLFTLPALVLVALFVGLPVLMAAWVSVSGWRGRGSPFSGDVPFVGLDNYQTLLAGAASRRRTSGPRCATTSGTCCWSSRRRRSWRCCWPSPSTSGRSRVAGFFRTAFYFPSVTSSVAIVVVFLFLFGASGAVNQVIGWFGVNGPNWFADPRGVLHLLLGAVGVDSGGALANHDLLGISLWEWLAGPSVAMSALIILAVFTTSGTFMLLFLAGLQNISAEVGEAATVDGASAWQRLRYVTVPMLRPVLFTVLTLGLVGTWQVFDQVYTGTQGGPAKTTITPAYLSYTAASSSSSGARAPPSRSCCSSSSSC